MWEIPLIACAGWAASKLLRRLGPQAQHVAWVATLLLGVLTPAVPVCRAILQSAISSGRGAAAVLALVAMEGAGGSSAARAGALHLPAWLIGLVFGLYACTLVYFATRLLWLFTGARALVRASNPARLHADTGALWQRVRRAFRMADASLLSSANVRGAVTIGAGRPAIILPAGFVEQCTEHDFLSALGHELAHVERRDYAKNLLYEVGCVLTAFHPVTWIVKAQIVRTREMICDAMVVERLVDTRTYRQSLLRLAEQMMATRALNIHAVGIFDANILEERIMVMKTKRPVSGSLVRAGLCGSVTLLLLAAMFMGTAFAKRVDAPVDHDGQWGTVYHPGGDVTAPVLKFAPDPEFPKSAQVPAGANMVCVIGLIVDRDGMPQDVHVVRSAGKDFDASAMRAVQQYKFKPALRFGSPVAVAIKVEVNFRKY
jgi:TonB family protein